MNASLIHKWMSDPRFVPVAEDPVDVIDALFLPIEVTFPGMSVNEAALDRAPSALCATRRSAEDYMVG